MKLALSSLEDRLGAKAALAAIVEMLAGIACLDTTRATCSTTNMASSRSMDRRWQRARAV
ncbi:MAG: hypothetical protein ACLPN5_21065 [Roseiarcus sp.]